MNYSVTLQYVLFFAPCILFVIYIFHFFSKRRRRLDASNNKIHLLLDELLEEYRSLKDKLEIIGELCFKVVIDKIDLEHECKQLQFIVEAMNNERVELMEQNLGLKYRAFEIKSEHSDFNPLSLEVLKLYSNLELQIDKNSRKLKEKTNNLRELESQINDLKNMEGRSKHRCSELECRIAELKPDQSVDGFLFGFVKFLSFKS